MPKIESNIGILWKRAFAIWHDYGFGAFVKGILLYLFANGIVKKDILISSCDFTNLPDVKLNIEGMDVKIISKSNEVNDLIAQGFDFANYDTFFRDIHNLKESVSQGSKLFAVFINKELASIVWVAFNEKAARTIDNLPCMVHYEQGETYHGGSETFPKFRNKGLHSYNLSRMYHYLKENGVTIDKHAQVREKTDTTNRIERFGCKVYKKLVLTRVLLWSFWSEKQLGAK